MIEKEICIMQKSKILIFSHNLHKKFSKKSINEQENKRTKQKKRITPNFEKAKKLNKLKEIL